MKTTKYIALIAICIMLGGLINRATAQKPYYQDPLEIKAAAIAELNTLMKDEKLQKEIAKRKIKGAYTYKIKIDGKSRIASMQFLNKSSDGTVEGQNFFNYLVREHKFSFKLPKGNYYSLEYTFKTD